MIRGGPLIANHSCVRLIELGVGGRVHLVGHCSDMPAAYALADIVVSASVEPEAFGRVAVEAQCMGRPVIATAIMAARWKRFVRERAVFSFLQGMRMRLARRLFGLLRAARPSAWRWASAARRDVRREFSVEAMQAATLAVYERVMERGR